MITNKEYHKLTEAKVKGLRVRCLYDLQNGNTVIPAGTILTILRKSSGYLLKGKKCECCGISPLISKVEPGALDFYDPTE